MTQGIASHSKTAFNINKNASMAMAALNIPEAASNAYAWASKLGGPVAGAAAAALAIAAQVGQLNAIKSQSFGGGSGITSSPTAPSLSLTGGSPVTPTTSESSKQGSQINVYIEGSAIGNDEVRRVIVDAIQRAQSNDELILRTA